MKSSDLRSEYAAPDPLARSSRPRRTIPTPHDSTGLLSVYSALLLFVPATLTFAPLGGAGSPAQLFGLLLLVVWAAFRVQSLPRWHPAPLTIAFFVFVCAIAASVISALIRPINSVEYSVVTLGALSMACWTGVFLSAAEGIATLERLVTLARRLVFFGALIALLGLAQWLTKQSIVDAIQIPGLSASREAFGVGSREGFSRPAGTATHPIEFGIVVAMLLPLAIHFALEDRTRAWIRRWLPALLILAMIPLSLSRSTLIGAVAGAVILVPTWSRVRQILVVVFIVIGGAALFVTIPGLSGSILGLFTGVGDDTSLASRTDSYGLVWEFFLRNPLFGRGFATFLPDYRILDNQLLLLLVEAGLVGLVSCVVLLVMGVCTPIRIRRHIVDPGTRSFAQALAASVAAGACGFVAFDSLSFPMAAGLVFLLLGMSAALYRFVVPVQSAETVAGRRSLRPVAIVGTASILATLAACFAVYRAPGHYFGSAYVTLVLPQTHADGNALSQSASLVEAAGLVAHDVDPGIADPVVGDVSLLDMGIYDGAMVRQVNRGGQWAYNFSDQFVEVQATGSEPAVVADRIDDLVRSIEADLATRESSLGVAPKNRLRLIVNPPSASAAYVTGHRSAAVGGCLVLGMALSVAAVAVASRRETNSRRGGA